MQKLKLTLICFAVCALSALPTLVEAQPQTSEQPAQQQSEPVVVAKVNDDQITQRELQAHLQPRLQQIQQQAQAQGQQITPEIINQLRQQALSTLIESRLVEEHIANEGPEVEPKEVESNISTIKKQLEEQQVDFNEFLAMRGYTEDSLRKRIKGSLGWQKYHETKMSDENLKSFFEENQDQFQAESYEEAPKQQVSQMYMASLWENIVEMEQPEAKIEVMQPKQPKQTPGNAPQPPQAPQGGGNGSGQPNSGTP